MNAAKVASHSGAVISPVDLYLYFIDLVTSKVHGIKHVHCTLNS